jgi:hypothetical protein
MTTPKASRKSGFLTVKHLDIRLQKIRSLKTNALKPLKIAMPTLRASQTKPSTKSIMPYGLVIASLVLSGVTASEAHAAAIHQTAKSAHVVTHVARRHAVPAQQIDPVAQFFQGLFGGPPVARTAAGRAGEGEYVPYDSPTYDTSTPPDNSSADQAAQAMQQLNDENALIQSMQAAQEQNDEANAATLQTEINANNGN